MRKATVGILMAAAALIWAAPAFATFPGQNGKFVDARFIDQVGSIVTYNPDGSGFFRVTSPSNAEDRNPAWSADGQRIAFERFQAGSYDLYVVNADGTGLTNVTQSPNNEETEVAWSPDGTKLVFFRCCWSISVINVDGTGLTPVATPPPNTLYRRPKWSPDGTKIAFSGGPFNNEHDIYTVNPDGSGLTNITNTPSFVESTFDWSPDSTKFVFDGFAPAGPNILGVYVMNRDGSGRVNLTPNPTSYDGAPVLWSPDGAHILFSSFRDPPGFYIVDPDGNAPTWFAENSGADDWQPASVMAPAGPVRPRGATPLRVPLVPAHRKCNAPDRTHGAPLAYGSCSRPIQLSQYLTVGTGDANRAGPRSEGSVKFSAVMGNKVTPLNEADMQLDVRITDVRDSIRLSDYIAELRVLTTVRLTQRIGLQTTVDFPFNWSVPCAATPDPNVGATCESNTSANALVPGAIPEGYRSNWQLGQVQVQDGGEDGEGATEGDNTLFMKQGIFVP